MGLKNALLREVNIKIIYCNFFFFFFLQRLFYFKIVYIVILHYDLKMLVLFKKICILSLHYSDFNNFIYHIFWKTTLYLNCKH